jgi:transcriptional regulator with XRE-family HTH domain
MTTINQRLKSIFEEKKIKVNAVAAELEIDYRQFNNWLNNTKPSVEGLQKILKYFPNIDARWLLTGEGEMINQPGAIPELVEEPKAPYKNSDCCSRCKDLEKQIALYEKVISLYENPPKKEATNEDSTQLGEDAKQNKAS